jgi:hypothetical protein
MNITRNLLIFLIILFISVSFQPVLFAQDAQTKPEVSEAVTDKSSPENIEKEPTLSPAGSSRLKVYRDPETGEFLDSPPERLPAEIQRADEESISTSHEGLREVDMPGGGVMIDLKGRFRHYQTATKDADGNIIIRCTPEVPAPKGNNETDTNQTPSNNE